MQRYFSNELINNKFKLLDSDIYHIKTVMRMNVNDLIEVVYENNVYLAKIISNYEIEKVNKIETKSKISKEIVLIVPLLKETKMDLILQKSTELGVSKIIPIITERTLIKLSQEKKEKRISRWIRICKEASEQSKRTDIPIISEFLNINDLYFDGLKILCSTRNKNNILKNVLKKTDSYDRIIILIGPEGGLSEKEEEMLIKKGFIPTALGELILRVETVPMYILSIINYEMSDCNG